MTIRTWKKLSPLKKTALVLFWVFVPGAISGTAIYIGFSKLLKWYKKKRNKK